MGQPRRFKRKFRCRARILQDHALQARGAHFFYRFPEGDDDIDDEALKARQFVRVPNVDHPDIDGLAEEGIVVPIDG